MSAQDDNNLINFIATTVEALRARVDTISDQMATKVDLANLRDRMATLENQMATKEDLLRVESRLDTMGEQMATKDGLGRLETTMHGEFEQVHIRLDSIDRGMGSRMGSHRN
jgi:hypothetical protein